jgi:DNA-binding MarR family transcriptional regulator
MAVPNLWEPFGLRGSPFFQEELRPSGEDEHPITLFVGRTEELRRIARRVVSDRSSRTIVQGDPGIGKTSFVNRLKAEVAGAGVLTHEYPVRITSETTRSSFVADVLRTLVRIRLAAGPGDRDADPFWKKTVRLLEGEEILGGSMSAFGIGAGVSREYVTPQAPADSLFEHLGEALERMHADFGSRVLLHVNNLENLSARDARDTAVLLRDLRDYLLLPGAHWVFVGATGVEESIFRHFPQVGGIFPQAETLQPLEPAQIEELLSLRYAYLAIEGRTPVPPVRPAAAARLYTLYQGDLRDFLRMLGDAADRGLGLRGVEPMTEAEVLHYVASSYERGLRRRIGDGDFQALSRIVAAAKGGDPEFRVTDAVAILGITQPGASQMVDRLVRSGVIRQTRSRGRSVYYRPTGEMLAALGAGPDLVRIVPR